jgi:1-deoxy-D-xylulose-5-phosphate reductoisomerase
MGRKITVDSANLMNKGLEAIEARWLFDLSLERIDVVLHPQSIVHSLVTFSDGSTKAQLGLPDMRLPIQYALSHPERWENNLERLDLAAIGTLSFGGVDRARYPALG